MHSIARLTKIQKQYGNKKLIWANSKHFDPYHKAIPKQKSKTKYEGFSNSTVDSFSPGDYFQTNNLLESVSFGLSEEPDNSSL